MTRVFVPPVRKFAQPGFFTWSSAVRKRPLKPIAKLEDRLAEEAKRLREEAKLLPQGALREDLIRRARQAETGSQVSEWLRSPGLQPPT